MKTTTSLVRLYDQTLEPKYVIGMEAFQFQQDTYFVGAGPIG